jgi:hypothetical protein
MILCGSLRNVQTFPNNVTNFVVKVTQNIWQIQCFAFAELGIDQLDDFCDLWRLDFVLIYGSPNKNSIVVLMINVHFRCLQREQPTLNVQFSLMTRM